MIHNDMQVLSVDDERVNQQVMQSLLWAQDYELVQVVSACVWIFGVCKKLRGMLRVQAR